MTEPITVAHALRALELEIEDTHSAFTSWARHSERYRAVLEYLRVCLMRDLQLNEPPLESYEHEYAAVAPIVARWKEEGKP